jgi:hypothetical protein
MLIYISHDPESDKDLYLAAQVRQSLENFMHSTIMVNNLSDLGIAYRKDIIRRCDAIYVIRDSRNYKLDRLVKDDINFCKELEIPIYYHDEFNGNVPELLTEHRCPIQVREFMNVIMKMYRVHLKKNADYSPANILGTGSIGVIVRMWDKMARIMNLAGFNIQISKTADLNTSKNISATNEPMEDSFWDIAVYAVIKILLDKNVWGK